MAVVCCVSQSERRSKTKRSQLRCDENASRALIVRLQQGQTNGAFLHTTRWSSLLYVCQMSRRETLQIEHRAISFVAKQTRDTLQNIHRHHLNELRMGNAHSSQKASTGGRAAATGPLSSAAAAAAVGGGTAPTTCMSNEAISKTTVSFRAKKE
jgi:hypothetical protein